MTWKSARGDPRRMAWRNHYHDARYRGIPFYLTFEEWVAWWKNALGPHWMRKRGNRAHQYVMARIGDKGAYEIGNVKCITQRENRAEQVITPEMRVIMNKNLTGWPKGKPRSAKEIRRLKRLRLGTKHTPATLSKMSESQLARWGRRKLS